LEFLRVVPTVWDETKVLDGSVGEHIIMARRSGRNWFVGGMTADHPYNMQLPLGFLGKGNYTAHIFADPKDNHASYEGVVETKRAVTSRDALDVSMRVAGGVAAYFEPQDAGEPHTVAVAQ
jgi:alpha-glucosidase